MHINFRGQEIHYSTRKDFWDVVESGKWEPETFDILDKYIVPGKSFIDIGAWIGVISLYAEKLGAVVYAVEPDSVAYAELFSNCVLNGSSGVHLIPAAISDIAGMTMLSTSSSFGNSESSLVRYLQPNIKGIENVDSIMLSGLIRKNNITDICLIKIDCEGSEEVFIDFEFVNTLMQNSFPTIWISFHPNSFVWRDKTINNIIDLLFPHYKFTAHDKEYTEEDFRQAMDNLDHTFLLLKR